MKVLLLPIADYSSQLYLNLAEGYFEGLQEAGLDKHAFYDGSVNTPNDFLNLAFSPHVLLYLVVDVTEDLPAVCGHFHLNGFQGRLAIAHFSLSKKYQGRKGIEVGKAAYKELFKLERESGGPLVTTLVGLTPITNRLACRFIQLVGFKKQLVIKDACEFKDGQFTDGLMTILEAE